MKVLLAYMWSGKEGIVGFGSVDADIEIFPLTLEEVRELERQIAEDIKSKRNKSSSEISVGITNIIPLREEA